MTGSDAALRLKQEAARRAADLVQPGMVVGLGEGSTAIWAVRRIGELVQAGRLDNIVGIAASPRMEDEARRVGITITTLSQHPVIDLTIDGADEVDPQLDLIKGGGGALLREIIVAQVSGRVVIVADRSKLSLHLGEHWPIPVEVLPFAWRSQARFLESLGATWRVRLMVDDRQFVTDSGNMILDCAFGPMADPAGLATILNARAGVVEHGLFIGLATDLVVAGPDGIEYHTRD